MPHYQFKKDLEVAQKTEEEIADFLVENANMELISYNDDNRYDLLMKFDDGTECTFELKEDFSCKRTGNVGVEYSCRGRPSGIEVSKADFYIYKVHEPSGNIGLYAIPTYDLKKMISNKLYFRTVNGGDKGSNALCYLFKLDVIHKYFDFLGNV